MPDIADSPSAADAASLLRDASFLASLRRDLLRFACLYLNHDDDSAEDAVQEALLPVRKFCPSDDDVVPSPQCSAKGCRN